MALRKKVAAAASAAPVQPSAVAPASYFNTNFGAVRLPRLMIMAIRVLLLRRAISAFRISSVTSVGAARFELTTPGSGGRCSIQMSYAPENCGGAD